MASRTGRFRGLYGSHPLHLLTMIAGFALFGYVLLTAEPAKPWKPEGAWWQSAAVWLTAAFVAHDLVLFPVYALADRLLGIRGGPRRRTEPLVPVHNYLRLPALGSGLILLIFFPGIIRQGAALYLADTGLTQQHFLGRWLLLTAMMFAVSAVVYAIRVALARRQRRHGRNESRNESHRADQSVARSAPKH